MATQLTALQQRALRTLFFACLALLLAASCNQAHAQGIGGICRVTTAGNAGNDGNDGSDWTAPMDLQTALTTTGCQEIWVAAGVYKPVVPADPNNVTYAERKTNFQILPGVALFGGFDGSETLRVQRDWQANLTVLSGDIDNNDDVNANGVDPTAAAINGSNSYNVVYLDGTTATPILASTGIDGFIITAGNADAGVQFDTGTGGGLFCDVYETQGTCSPSVSQVVFRGNSAALGGGGMVNLSGISGGISSPTLTDVTFRGNAAGSFGGGMVNSSDGGQASPVLTRVVFVDNIAGTFILRGRGGALANLAMSSGTIAPTLDNVTFAGNTSHGSDSGGLGGAVFNFATGNGICAPVFTNVTFHANHATALGGAVHNRNFINGTLSPVFHNVTFSGNSAVLGGGAVTNTYHGALVIDVTFNNVTFHGNSAGTQGGAIYNKIVGGPIAPGTFNVTLSNVIAWGDSSPSGAEIANAPSAVPVIDHSIIQGSGGSANWNFSFGIDAGFNQDVDPLLGSLANHGGFTDTLLPASNSPAIDAGSCSGPATDQRGTPRPQGSTCDVGAVELPVVAFLQPVYGNGQSATLWHDFANPLIVQVRGLDNVPATGIKIAAMPAANGQPGARCTSDRTGSSGFAYLYCRANGHAGPYAVTINAVNVSAGATPTTSFTLSNIDDGDTLFRNGFELPGPATSTLRAAAGQFALEVPGNLPEGTPVPIRFIVDPQNRPLVRIDALRQGGTTLLRVTRYRHQRPIRGTWQTVGAAAVLHVRTNADGTQAALLAPDAR